MKQLTLPPKELYPLIAEALGEVREVYITGCGNSMTPFLQDGRDQAVLAPLEERRIRRGDVVFYERPGGQFVLHRVLEVGPDGVMTMLGDGQWTPEPGVRPEQLRAFVPRVVRNGREISCERGLTHRLMTLWLLRIRFPRIARLGLRAARRLRRLFHP